MTGNFFNGSAAAAGGWRMRRLAGALALLLVVPIATQAAPPAPQRSASDAGLPDVTIEGTRERELRLQVDKFVAAVVTPPVWHRSLMRWNGPICPLVLGLARSQGEYILGRISQAAHDAGAPLAGKDCHANLYVVVSAQPDKILKDWVAQNPRIDTRDGSEPLRRFVNSTQPVRVWYDAQSGCSGAGAHAQANSAAQLASVMADGVGLAGSNRGANPATGLGTVACDDTMDTHLTFGEVRSITSVMIVADANKLKHVSLGQLADYASLVGLINIRLDTDGGGAPTILGLFRDAKPQDALTRWDRALLYSLYHTPQSTNLQLNDMEFSMAKHMAP